MKKHEQLAKEYAQEVGDDCLCQRTQPGTPVGECIWIFCGCDIDKAYKVAFLKAIESAIDRVKYSRFSIVIENNEYTQGYIQACKDIQGRIEKLKTDEV